MPQVGHILLSNRILRVRACEMTHRLSGSMILNGPIPNPEK